MNSCNEYAFVDSMNAPSKLKDQYLGFFFAKTPESYRDLFYRLSLQGETAMMQREQACRKQAKEHP